MSHFKRKKNRGKHSNHNKLNNISFELYNNKSTISPESENSKDSSLKEFQASSNTVNNEPIVNKPEVDDPFLASFRDLNLVITPEQAEASKDLSENKLISNDVSTVPNKEENKTNTSNETEDLVKPVVTVVSEEPNAHEDINEPEEELNENHTLLISEEESKVFLPYSQKDITSYLNRFSNKYTTANDVIKNEFTYSLKYFSHFSKAARFREAFALYKDREGKTTFESISFAFKVMKISNLQPAIIAACKSERVFNDYLNHLEDNDLENFKHFKIEYKLTPISK